MSGPDETGVRARREAVLAALVSAGAAGLSGEVLAARLGCSRAAIHRHVEALRRGGTEVIGERDGYRLADDADPIVASAITDRLRPPGAGPLRWLVETGSTNDDLAAEARAGAPEGLVIGADLQHAGRGRRGRRWVSAARDALLFSVLLRPAVAPVDAGLLPIVAAVAVARALGERARIVWPNDILIDATKVCGILCEMSADQERVAWALVGIGVNVRGAPALTDARWAAGSLAQAGDRRTRADVLSAALVELGDAYRGWLSDGGAAVRDEFARRDALRGRSVRITLADHDIDGICEGIDELGRLLVRVDGRRRALASGEVTRVSGISPREG